MFELRRHMSFATIQASVIRPIQLVAPFRAIRFATSLALATSELVAEMSWDWHPAADAHLRASCEVGAVCKKVCPNSGHGQALNLGV